MFLAEITVLNFFGFVFEVFVMVFMVDKLVKKIPTLSQGYSTLTLWTCPA